MRSEHHGQRPLHVSSNEWNLQAGRIVSILHGLTRVTMKVLTDHEAILHVRCSSEHFHERSVHIGQRVMVKIHADAVLLGTDNTWPGKKRWNRWAGRIVLVHPAAEVSLITVKLNGNSCTLACTGPVAGQVLAPEVWNPVNIVIDPEKISLMLYQNAKRSRWVATGADPYERSRNDPSLNALRLLIPTRNVLDSYTETLSFHGKVGGSTQDENEIA